MNQATKIFFFYGSLAVLGVLVVGWLAYRQSLPLGPAGLGAQQSAAAVARQLPPLSQVAEQHPALGAAFDALGRGDLVWSLTWHGEMLLCRRLSWRVIEAMVRRKH